MKIIVGVSDMKVSNDSQSDIITYSLGSCIGLVVFDPFVKTGGILHYMLPESFIDREKAERNPYMFADTGIPLLFKEAYKYNATKKRMKVAVFGGSQILDQKGFFNIGKRNYMALKKLLFKNNVLINYEDVGGNVNRTIRLEIKTGDIFVKTSGSSEVKI
ncbi:MAG: chemotaxis protein CheD [Desulfamplus sp.]|nr:chemotaxis protein CheD [Desulfamplus sp.]MBF0412924.1 chemotaxis protein CheD [Desulfamplus sp.]